VARWCEWDAPGGREKFAKANALKHEFGDTPRRSTRPHAIWANRTQKLLAVMPIGLWWVTLSAISICGS